MKKMLGIIISLFIIGIGYMIREGLILENVIGYKKGSCYGNPCFADSFPVSYSPFVGWGIIIIGIYIFLVSFSRMLKKSSKDVSVN